jgi:chemotaxis response regulator CheB
MGPWGIAIIVLVGVALTERGRGLARKVTKEGIRAGYLLSDKSSGIIGELKEKADDLIAEVRAEQSEENDEHSKPAGKRNKAAASKNSSEE